MEVTSGTLSHQDKKFQVLDTPGVNSLIPMSEDERVTRDILLHESEAHLIQVMDAKNLRRGLLVSLQLLEMRFSFLAVLNMWDEARSRGIEIQAESLSRILGIPILKTVATRRKGLERIKDHLHSTDPPSISITYPEAIERGVSSLLPLLPEVPMSRRSLALMILSGDESLTASADSRLAARLEIPFAPTGIFMNISRQDINQFPCHPARALQECRSAVRFLR